MSPYFPLEDDDWTGCGPGSRSALGLILGGSYESAKADVVSDAIVAVHRAMPDHLKQLGLEAPLADAVQLRLTDTEHVLCEASKYIANRNMKAWTPRDAAVAVA